CEAKQRGDGIEFKASTCNNQGSIQCTITTQDDQVYHYIEVLNMRPKSCKVDVRGFTQSEFPPIEFKHRRTQRRGSEWQTLGIPVRARTYKGGGPYSGQEATVISVATAHGEQTIYTQFTYTPDGESPSTAPDLAFEVDY
ncbi:MAG: hypothetical protein ACREBU_20555, partial [Nitrososphaera sp.]